MNGVALAYITWGMVSSNFHLGVVATLREDWEGEGLIRQHIGVRGHHIARNRNGAVREFLAQDCEWLWFVDTDIVLPKGVLPALLGVADPWGRPIVAALYYSMRDSGELEPVWSERRNGDPYAPVTEAEMGALRPLAAAGMGCTLIHRCVLDKMETHFAADPEPWFGYDVIEHPDGRRRGGEDTTFCRRAAECGYPTWGLGLVVGHEKRFVLSE